jgi:hypothetical protein
VIEGEVIAPRHSTVTPSADDLISPRQPDDRAGNAAAPDLASAPPEPGAADETESERLARLDALLDDAAQKGTKALETAWVDDLTKADRIALKVALDRRHRATAAAADKAAAERTDA